MTSIFPSDKQSFFVIAIDEENEQKSLEIYDGNNFKVIVDQSTIIDWPWIRDIIETENKDLWIGHSETYGPILFKNGQYKIFGEADGYADSGAFSLLNMGNGKIWAGGRKYISEYDGEKWKIVHTTFSTVRMMRKGRDGSVWVASGVGFTVL